MSVIRRLTNLARGYVKTLGNEAPPAREEVPASEDIGESRRVPEPPVEAEGEPAPNLHREPPKPKKRTL